jgi:hypothetical protein
MPTFPLLIQPHFTLPGTSSIAKDGLDLIELVEEALKISPTEEVTIKKLTVKPRSLGASSSVFPSCLDWNGKQKKDNMPG